jgi:hypothetical protein
VLANRRVRRRLEAVMTIAQTLRLSPGHGDVAYLAISLVVMADGHISEIGRTLLELAARELEVDAARSFAHDPNPQLSAPARRWLVDACTIAAWIDGEPSAARRQLVAMMTRTFDQRSSSRVPALGSSLSRWRAAALRSALQSGASSLGATVLAPWRVVELGWAWHAIRNRLAPPDALARG